MEKELDFGFQTRPYPGFQQNGDRYYIDPRENGCLVAVIDGLGHGAGAAEASEAAIQCLLAHQDLPPEEFFYRCDSPLKRTRGVGAGISLIDLTENSIIFAGVGNIGANVYNGQSAQTLISSYGVLGSGQVPKVKLRQAAFPPGALLVMFSDGLSEKYRLSEYYGLAEQPAQLIADVLFRDWSRTSDDATVVVVRREKA